MERQLRIMVLDTSATSRKILEVIVSREGHEVVCFGDPLEALRFLGRYGPADLLFLGMDLPKVDGFGVLKHLRGEPLLRSMVPIVLLSSRDGILRRVRARLSGAQRVVRKPLVQSRIVSLVCEYQRWSAPVSSRAAQKG
ncbi:response regulator [Ktedonobacter robiniae]|uniref:Response regulatory domain-containing protein n=1 Tax=Ktedonobacter robiniae TaxID=2778365 RepID=A0ABQ3URY0_9CHLR|nr:response regulator [Ktedonobacter robiniae]GHO55120.1 hypothetical protein KSB_35950 [Ktedonobacter robiniae]